MPKYVNLMTPEFRLFQNNLFRRNDRRQLPDGTTVGDDKYGIEMAFAPSDLADLIAAMREAMADQGYDAELQKKYMAARLKKGSDVVAQMKPERREKVASLYNGSWLMRAKTKTNLVEQGAVGTRAGKVLTPADEAVVYAGSYGMAALSIRFQTAPTLMLVAYVNGYMKTRDGEKLAFGNPGGGQRTFASMFGGVNGGVSELAPADLEEVF